VSAATEACTTVVCDSSAKPLVENSILTKGMIPVCFQAIVADPLTVNSSPATKPGLTSSIFPFTVNALDVPIVTGRLTVLASETRTL
jgi:hypothetical protein